MYIVHLTSEFSPIAKVGGLGDVVAGLSKALIEEGARVEVVLPFYDLIDRKKLTNLKVDLATLSDSTIWSAEYEGIPLILIEAKNKESYFERKVIYGEKDDILRFTSFTKTALDYLLKKGKHPDVLNIHDWLTALAAPLYYEMYKERGLKIGGIMTTIHNMKYQGVCSPEKLSHIGFPIPPLLKQKKAQPPKINLLKGALAYSDMLTTVSPTYAKEIQGKEGFGLGPLIVQRKKQLRGILNGIDTSYWNPETDPLLTKNYPASGRDLEGILETKKENQRALQKQLKMKTSPAPLFTCISRLVEQKGPEMILYGVEYILTKGGQFILLGSTPDPALKKKFDALAKTFKDHPHAHFHFVFDEKLAHQTYAAADFILVPSLFEPCGLTQMIALRYGTLPIVHKVGGLNDTVFDAQNGYTFDTPSKKGVRAAIDRAFEDFNTTPQKRLQMIKNGFEKDWSWKTSARTYLKTYQETMN